MAPGPATTQGIKATGFTPAGDAEPRDAVIDLDQLWRDYQRSRVWMSARGRRRATYVARTEHPTGAAVMRF
jgi:hypothetical protein